MKLPWSNNSKDEIDQQSNGYNAEEPEQIEKKNQEDNISNPIVNSSGKKYSYNSLPEDLKKLVNNIRLIDKNIQIEKDFLQSIAIGRNEYCRQLKSKLKSIESIDL